MFTTLKPAEAEQETAPRFPFSFIDTEGNLYGADTRTGICEALIEGYEDLEDDPEMGAIGDVFLEARTAVLAELAGAIQVALLAAAENQDQSLQEKLTEDELTALLTPKDGVVLDFDSWTRVDVPLILLSTQYAPYNLEVMAPDGEGIIWISAHTETDFLNSLNKLGAGVLYIDHDRLEERSLELDAAA